MPRTPQTPDAMLNPRDIIEKDDDVAIPFKPLGLLYPSSPKAAYCAWDFW